MTGTICCTSGRTTRAETEGQTAFTVEQLIRETHAHIERAGVRLSPSKVSRLCRDYVNVVAGRGVSFGTYLANAVALDADNRRTFDDVYYRLTHSDLTGETAVRNVMRGARRG